MDIRHLSFLRYQVEYRSYKRVLPTNSALLKAFAHTYLSLRQGYRSHLDE